MSMVRRVERWTVTAVLEPTRLQMPGRTHQLTRWKLSKVRAFVRPDQFELSHARNGKPSLTATVLRIHADGSVARLDLQLTYGKLITEKLLQDRFAELKTSHGTACS